MIAGTLNAQGTAQKPIVFTTILDDSVGGATSSDTAQPLSGGSGDWEGFAFIDTLARGSFSYCTFKYGGYGNSNWNASSGGMIYISKGKVSVKDSRFFGGRGGYTHGGAAVYMNGGTLSGSYNTVFNCTHGIYADGKIDSAAFTHSNFDSISGFGARASDSTHRVDASNCWWHSSDGPSGVGPGKGAKVSSYVIFLPYATTTVSGNSPIVAPSLLTRAFKSFVNCRQGQNGRLVLRYALSEGGMVTFKVYSLTGRTAFSYTSSILPRQTCGIVLPLLPAGKYLYQFTSPTTKVDNVITCFR